ncbi:MAG: class I SAM-dependent methyltransferase [Acidobacteriota bacterium]|nr:class I SAM-dependent methyltransferase [Acidobacteriota bacterium]
MDPWNLTTEQWSQQLLSQTTLEAAASGLKKGELLPWTRILFDVTSEGEKVLDLGAGRGENAAALALEGRAPTLVDWSLDNLVFGQRLFDQLGKKARFCQSDITRPLPFADGSFDVVYSCGVFEYFTAPQIESILREALRVSRRTVVIMVPNALSAAYRIGMWYLKATKKWNWGGEVPSVTLKPRFRAAGFRRLREFSVASRHSLDFLVMPMGSLVQRVLLKLFGRTDSSRPAVLRQGYLLVTVGSKSE